MFNKLQFLFFIGLCFAQIVYIHAQIKSFITLPECEQIALSNHDSIRLAQEEVETANAKKHEALRAVFPTVNLRAEQTDGKAVENLGTPDFTEQSYGVQASQPIFQGGKVYRTYRQTKANWESVKAKYEKTRQEVLYNIREAYWNMVKAEKALRIYQKALSDLEEERRKAVELRKKDTINDQLYLTILTQYNQSKLQVESAQAELESRLWQWTAALGLETPPDYRPIDLFIPAVKQQFSMAECLKLAEANHPDLVTQAKAAEAAYLGAKIARSYYWPQFDVNGNYGKSGGAFEGETLTLREDWSVGVRMSMNFTENSINLSGLRQKTSPKLGQSSRTELQTVSGSVGLLDTLKNRSEKKEARLVYHQAQAQMKKTKMEVMNRVREAYATMKKSFLHLKMAENELKLAQTDYSVSKIKSTYREVPVSERAVNRNKLAQAETGLIEAQASYAIALADINRAVGIPDQFQVKLDFKRYEKE